MDVWLIIKLSSIIMQGKRKSYECHISIFFFHLLSLPILTFFEILKFDFCINFFFKTLFTTFYFKSLSIFILCAFTLPLFPLFILLMNSADLFHIKTFLCFRGVYNLCVKRSYLSPSVTAFCDSLFS